MDYEKKLALAKEALDSGSYDKETIEYIFPELKESKDEMIRKKVIATIHLYYGEPLEDEAKEMIAWLEKQDEHAKFRNKIQIGDRVTRNEDGVLVNLSQLKRIAKPAEKQCNNMGISEATKQELEDNLNKALEKETPESWNEFLEKQGEQKPADNKGMNIDEEFINTLGTMLNDGLPDRYLVSEERIKMSAELLFSIARKQLKNEMQEWREEDNKIIEEIINDIECARAINYHAPKEGYEFRENWLKSLKDRVQPKKGWSEEDERIKDNCIEYVKAACLDRDESDECVDWLKSLRPQNRWKPSDEQIVALKHASNDCSIAFADMKILATLYEQLKALHHYEQDT